ncbi:hypothetical protein [Maribellus maritimus]|uniref:hypothetical protein n=1 Tax=Maribellus maritimus TaxID=2870838 RepID=UPI001EEA32AC|nr:hypothetical protein [Maribellus maritimus]MCG6191071.1 hypothetical protein [Maribellus maritimus]
MKPTLCLNILLLLFLLFSCSSEPGKIMSPNQSVFGEKQNLLYVADETANRIYILNTAEAIPIKQIELKTKPGGLALSPDETKLYVTLSASEGELLEIDLTSLKVTRRLKVGHTPMSPVVTPDGKTLFFCNRFANTVVKVNLSDFSVEQTASADREPVSLACVPGADLLLVANHLPSGSAKEKYHSAKVSVFDASSTRKIKEIDLPNGSNGLNKITISPDQKFAYVTHVLGRYNVPTNQVERGWINTNALSIIDVAEQRYLCTVMLDDLDLGAANPYDVECSKDGNSLFVSHAGTDELSIIDRKALHIRIEHVADGSQPTLFATSLDEIHNDLSFLQNIRNRIDLHAVGARGIALGADKIYVSMYFSGSLAEVAIAKPAEVVSLSLGKQAEATEERLGEMYFNDARLCKQYWQSCTSCHQGDARVDGLNWDLLNDGIGNPKNTKSMLLAHATPPAMVTGIRSSASVAVIAGVEHILFTRQPREITDAIDAYLTSLKPVASPYLVNGKLSEAAQRGEKVFEKARCLHCHSGANFTNLESFDVGEGSGADEGRKFDTPSLIEVWRTAPYLYDGKAKTIKEVLTTYNINQKHGQTADLTEQELSDLEEYCLSL